MTILYKTSSTQQFLLKIFKIPVRHFQSGYNISRFVGILSLRSLKLSWLVYDFIATIIIQARIITIGNFRDR